MNVYLKTLSVSALAALFLGCGTESNKPPLVPEIVYIEVHQPSVDASIYALDDQLSLYADILYSDGSSSTTTNELDWHAKKGHLSSSDIRVSNGEVFAYSNHGEANLSVTYRDELSSSEQKLVKIIPLSKIINISQNDKNITLNTRIDVNATTGQSIQMAADGEFNDTTPILDISSQIFWSSSNTTVAAIQSGTGLINVLSSGITEINASVFGEINATVELNITVE